MYGNYRQVSGVGFRSQGDQVILTTFGKTKTGMSKPEPCSMKRKHGRYMCMYICVYVYI